MMVVFREIWMAMVMEKITERLKERISKALNIPNQTLNS